MQANSLDATASSTAAGGMMDQLLQYTTNRIIELENLLLVDVEEAVLPAEVKMVFSQVENAGDLPAHHSFHG